MKRNQVRKLSYQGELGREYAQRARIFIRGVKDKIRMIFISKETLENGHCYLGLRPTVDTALIPLCHTRILQTEPDA